MKTDKTQRNFHTSLRSSYQTRTLFWKRWRCPSSEVLFVATLTRRYTSGRYPSGCGTMSWNTVASTCANPSSLRKPTSWFGQEAKKTLNYSIEQVFPVASIHSESHLRPFVPLCSCLQLPQDHGVRDRKLHREAQNPARSG